MANLVEYNDGKAGIRFELQDEKTCIGRGRDNDIVIEQELVSKAHALIEKVSDEQQHEHYTIRDLGSTNGTYVGDEKITAVTLWDGDIIRIGMSFFKFVDENQEDFSKTTELRKSWIPGVYYTKKPD